MKYAQERAPFGKPLASNQAIQFPLVELSIRNAEMIRNLVYKTAWQMDQMSKKEVAIYLSDKVSMCNYRANRLVCDAADRAFRAAALATAGTALRAHLPPSPSLSDHGRL